jgi:hypothetical protein
LYCEFILSPERGKLCFEHLETFSDAQNNLPLQGAETISEVDVLKINWKDDE